MGSNQVAFFCCGIVVYSGCAGDGWNRGRIGIRGIFIGVSCHAGFFTGYCIGEDGFVENIGLLEAAAAPGGHRYWF